MFKSVFAKYITTFMLIVFVSFLLLVLIITSMVNNYALDAKREQLSHAAHSAVDFLESYIEGSSSANFGVLMEVAQDEVDRMLIALAATGENVSMMVVDERGNVLRMVENGAAVPDLELKLPYSVVIEAISGDELSRFESMEGVFYEPQLYCAVPISTGDEKICGAVFACAASATLDELLGVMVKTVVVASIWVMLAALVAVYLITVRIISPLKSMSRMAKEFASGNFSVRAPVHGKDEVAELAVAFNNMAESLSHLEVMRNTFMANVSHDLRTPMTTISGFIDNILSGAIPPEKHHYYLDLIRTEVQRLARLVASLLDISRIQAGDRKFEMRPFDICEMARRIVISFEGKIESKHLDVEFNCDEERMMALADHDAIYQILYNICDNAVKFSRDGGLLRVSLAKIKENSVRVSVYNEGEGIAKADLPFVFERFYKGDKSRGLDKSGVGLGMFIAKTIIDAHQQRIWVESEQGAYCEFCFTLSLSEPEGK